MAKPKLKTYRLVRDFWDGERKHLAGTELEFLEGGQPRTAIDLEAEEAKQLEADKLNAEREAQKREAELEAARALVAEADAAEKAAATKK